MPDFEYLPFAPSEHYQKDPAAAVQSTIDIIKATATGLLSIHHGLEIDNPSKGYLFLGWESIDKHKELIASPIYKDLLGALSQCIDLTQPRSDLVHFSFDGKLEDVISAPDTEFTLLKLKEGKSAEEFLKLYSETLQPLLKPNPAKGLVAAGGIGSGIEQPGLYLIPLGWESKEKHQIAASDEAHRAKFIGLGAVVDLVYSVDVKLIKA